MNTIIIRREKQVSQNPTTFSRQELRNLATNIGVPRGRNIVDTIRNLREWHHRKMRLAGFHIIH